MASVCPAEGLKRGRPRWNVKLYCGISRLVAGAIAPKANDALGRSINYCRKCEQKAPADLRPRLEQKKNVITLEV